MAERAEALPRALGESGKESKIDEIAGSGTPRDVAAEAKPV